VALWAIDDGVFFSTDHPAVLVHIQKGRVLAMVGTVDGRAHRQPRPAVFPGILGVAKKPEKGGLARLSKGLNGTLPRPAMERSSRVMFLQHRFAARRDHLAGIAAPGMPAGSPGMEARAARHACQVIALTASGTDLVPEVYPAT
jgi:hypothetical protein